MNIFADFDKLTYIYIQFLLSSLLTFICISRYITSPLYIFSKRIIFILIFNRSIGKADR